MAQQTFEELVAAVKQAESRGKRYAADGKTLTTSPKGALGEMQVMPKTITDPGFGVAPARDKSPDEIARVGVDYLQAMKQRYGDTDKALIAYNWGPGSTDKWLASGADPKKLPEETKTYIERVKGFLGKDVSRETMAKKEREPLPESLPPMAKADQAQPTLAPAKVTMAKMDVKSMPASYQAAFALAALADAQDEEDDKAFNENKQTETETFFASYKPVNHLASLDLSVAPVMMADGGEVTERKDEPFFDAASRTYVDVLTGRRTPITERDFTAKEQMAMMDAVKRSQARGGKGRVDYQDYPSGDQIGPGFVDIRNTLGGFQYKQTPDGATVITDRYDFHGPRAAEYEKMGKGEKLVKSAANALSAFIKSGGGVRDAAGEIGDAYIGKNGPPVNIRIPVRRADGGDAEPTAEEIAAASKPATVNPNIQKQGEAARKLAAMRDVNTLPDPKTYAVASGLLGTRPDEMGFSIMHPKAAEIKAVAEPAFAAGTALQIAPALKAMGLGKVPGMVGEELNRRMLAGESLTPGFNTPAPINFIRRPAGGVFPTARGLDDAPVSALDASLNRTIKYLENVDAPAENKEAAIAFIDNKLHDYYKSKAGSVSDPVREALINGRIKLPKDSALEEQFPQALLNASRAGDVTAMKEIEKRFDNMTNIANYRVKPDTTTTADNAAAEIGFQQTILQQMKANPSIIPDEFLLRLAKKDTSKLSKQEQAAEVATIRQKLADNPTLFNTVFEPKLARLLDKNLLSNVSQHSVDNMTGMYRALKNAPNRQEGIMALKADVPITDIQSEYGLPNILGVHGYDLVEELVKINPKDLAQMSVPEFYAKAVPSLAKADVFKQKLKTVEELVKEGKPVPAEIGQFGTKEFLPTDSNGMTWREVIDPQATLVQAKFLGNSIAGYAKTGTYGAVDKGANALKDGDVRIFSLYDKNGHAVNNVEFVTPKVANNPDYKNKANTITQMYGNGVKTGNVAPENYPNQMLDLVNALQPNSIPPSIQHLFHNNGLMVTPVEPPLNAARQIQMNMFQPPAQRADGGMIERQPNDNRRYL